MRTTPFESIPEHMDWVLRFLAAIGKGADEQMGQHLRSPVDTGRGPYWSGAWEATRLYGERKRDFLYGKASLT